MTLKIPLFGNQGLFSLIVIVSALGYFVDIYDLVLFSTVRMQSLRDIGVAEADFFSKGIMLLNIQMAGMLAGGLLWGIIGDRRSRVAVLFGSIFLYSIANIANAFITSLDQYAVLRFIAGFGLAGEIGGAVTLVSETMRQDKRGLGTTLIAGFGLTGAIAAGLIAKYVDWRTAYMIGGILGLGLLAMRMKIFDSGMFDEMKKREDVKRGSLMLLLWPPRRLIKYLSCIFIGIPIYFVIVIFMTFAPELTSALGTAPIMQAPEAVMILYSGLAIGGLGTGFLSQALRSRKLVITICLTMTALAAGLYLSLNPGTPLIVYECLTFVMGVGCGYASVFFMIAAEQFGTNVRALAATSIPNFIRASTIIITAAYTALKGTMPLAHSALIIGIVCFVLAILALTRIEETFDRNLDFIER